MPNPNIKQIQIDNKVYDVKDALGRDAIATLNSIKSDKIPMIDLT